MKIIEYGAENADVVMLLHGGGLSWWNYREEALLLKEKYHVLLPVLDGHGDSAEPFTSIEDNACKLISYIDSHFQGSVLAIGGLSLGGQVLVEMLSQRKDICRCAIIESALLVPMPLTNALLDPMFGMSYGLISQKWFARAQFKSLKIQESLFEDYYRDTCKIKKQDMISFLKANSSYTAKPGLANTRAKALILAGGKEQQKILRSAQILHQTIPDSSLEIINNCYHGDLSINHPKAYVQRLNALISGAM